MGQNKKTNLIKVYGNILNMEPVNPKFLMNNDKKYHITCPEKLQRAINGILRACENLTNPATSEISKSEYLKQINYQIESFIQRARTIKDVSKRLSDEQILIEINNALQKNENLSLEFFIEHVPSYKKFVDEYNLQNENLNQ
jgi:hypothetical protein